MSSLLRSFINLIIKPILSLLTYITPSALQKSIIRIISIFRQILNLLIGRALPDLTRHFPSTDLTGLNAIVTGANSGIGLQIALELIRHGANVTLACRNLQRGESARQHILWNFPGFKPRLEVLELDTSDLESVKAFAEKWVELQKTSSSSSLALGESTLRLDILIHNAGISHAPEGKQFTQDGIETVYATNFLGSFLLTYLLEPFLSPTARVVLTSSTAQLAAKFSRDFSQGPVRGVCEVGFHAPTSKVPVVGWERGSKGDSARYGMTKGMQCIFARALQKRWDSMARTSKNTNNVVATGKRTAHSFTPGFTMTPIFAKFEDTSFFTSFVKDPAFTLLKVSTALATDVSQGAATGVWLASTHDAQVVQAGGMHWDRMTKEFSVTDRMSQEMIQRVWNRWERDCGIEWT